MEYSQSQSEPGEEMSSERHNSQDFDTDGSSGFRHQPFGQEGGGSVFPRHRLVILSLGLLNAVLLIAAVVIAINCAKGGLQVPDSAVTPIIIEMNYFRNTSDIIRAKLEAQAKLARERTNHLQLKLQVKHTETLIDGLQARIETRHTVKTNLWSNKTTLEETCGRCRQGWIFLKSSCYYFSNRESNSKKNWPDSKANCVSQGSDLLVINNLEEQQLLTGQMPTSMMTSHVWWQNGFWIGLTDKVTPGTWVWVNNETEVETGYWKPGQPSHEGPQSGNCAAFYYLPNAGKSWYNGNCLEHLYHWICEKEPSST